MKIELLKNPETALIDKVKIQVTEEYDESFLPPFENLNYLSSFSNNLTYKAGTAIQRFFDGFSRHTDDVYHQIFDGEDFIMPYNYSIEPNLLSGSGNSANGHYYLDDEILNKSIQFANQKKDVLDNAWYLLRDAEHSMEMGKYEISIIYMAIMIEFLVISQLSDYLDDNGNYKEPHKTKIEQSYGRRPSFVDKHFRYGLPLITDNKLPEEVLISTDFIYRVRNKLAHGKPLFEIEVINDNNITELNIRDIWFDLINDTAQVYNFFYDIIKGSS